MCADTVSSVRTLSRVALLCLSPGIWFWPAPETGCGSKHGARARLIDAAIFIFWKHTVSHFLMALGWLPRRSYCLGELFLTVLKIEKKKVAFARDFLCFYFPISRFQGNTTAWWTRKGTSVIYIRARFLSQQQFIFYHDAFFIPVSGENKLEKEVTLYSGWEWESRVKPHNQGRANGNSIRTSFLVTLWVLCWMMVSPRPG